jgi:Ca-activated chloride channel family protein
MRLFAWVVLMGLSVGAGAQSGVLLPKDKDEPDAKVLSLEEMTVNMVIDNGDAHVSVMQIFRNHSAAIEEGTYIFSLPTGSTVSDFATWDGPVRIPAVILERKRAEEIYEQAKSQAIDPGLLEAGERDGSDEKEDSDFTAKIVPIPAYGTKRLELEYHQQLKVDRYAEDFTFPLKPAEYAVQTAAHFRIRFELHSAEEVRQFRLVSKMYPLKFTQQDEHTVVGMWEGTNVTLGEDFETAWRLDPREAETLAVTTFRNPRSGQPLPDEMSPKPRGVEPGFFLAQTLIALPAASGTAATAATAVAAASTAPRNVVLLLDTSLSMQWDKLERSYGALEATLRSLTPADQFSVMVFNQDVSAYKPQPVAATPDAVQGALAFVKGSKLRGGTDLGKALTAGLAQAKAANSSLYVFTDGNSDRGATILTSKIAAAYKAQWKASPTKPRTNIFAVGDDANLPLLKLLAQNNGVLENVSSSEPVGAKLNAFIAHGSSKPVAGLKLDVAPASVVHTMYPLDADVYAGSIAAWVGDYLMPAKGVTMTASAPRAGKPLKAVATVDFPEESLEHSALPRLWAQARVNALLEQIARDGETRAAVDEIIALSRKYKFVTPYTSFLAAPRSLLRPRVIRPGDPVLRVHTDPAITSVIALFPFGLTKLLRHIADEDTNKGVDSDRLWETRFLAPADMQDGTYAVRLILRDAKGHTYSEQKTFVIASTTPEVKIKLERTRFHRGEVMLVKAGATASTRTLTARLDGGAPVDLRWSSAAATSVGQMRIPDTLAVGTYTLSVTAEDVAHNVGTQEVQIEVVP